MKQEGERLIVVLYVFTPELVLFQILGSCSLQQRVTFLMYCRPTLVFKKALFMSLGSKIKALCNTNEIL